MRLIKSLQATMPRLNPELCDGLAVEHLKGAEEYIHVVMAAAAESFPEGITYHGYRRCMPEEQFAELCNLTCRHGMYEMSPSDLYMVRFDFKFNGAAIPLFLLLPAVRRGGIITIRGSRFVISPVLGDNLFSVDDGNIFTQLTRQRLNFEKIMTSFIANGTTCKEDAVHCKLHNINDAKALKSEDKKALLANYLFAYNGFGPTMKKYFNCDVKFGTTEITKENYPEDKWAICESDGNPATRRIKDIRVSKTQIRFAVPREQFENDANLRAMIGGAFYILDHVSAILPVREEHLNNPALWRRILPRFIYRTIEGEAASMEEMNTHLAGLQRYIDGLVLKQFKYDKIDARNFEEFLVFMIKNFSHMENGKDIANTIGMKMHVLRYVLFDIISQIFTMMYALQRLSGPRLTEADVRKIMKKFFPADKIAAINSRHGEVSSLESATDCMLMKVTLPVVSQEKASRISKRKSGEMKDPRFFMHTSIFHTNSYLSIIKSSPSGRGRSNPFMNLGKADHEVREIEAIKDITENVKDLLSGKTTE